MQVDWIRRFQGMWLGCPPTRPGDLFRVLRPWNAYKFGRKFVRRSIELMTLQRGDMVLVMPGEKFLGNLIPCSINGDILYMEAMELWDHARLVG